MRSRSGCLGQDRCGEHGEAAEGPTFGKPVHGAMAVERGSLIWETKD